ncbi:MAG: hypothetical protein HQK54_00720 [Oligoflexales bacterium]|nr:hypothetical protein [Oligoflexales bacterium]
MRLSWLKILLSLVFAAAGTYDFKSEGMGTMGLFDKFAEYRKNKHKRAIEKTARVVKNPKAIREDRWAALEYLVETDDMENVVPALLERFEFSLEHGILDTREKELAMSGIVKYGEKVIPLVREKLQKTLRIAWPIKILTELADEATMIETLKSALDYKDVSFDQAAVDKNYDILCYLREYKLSGFLDKLSHFLKDPDERVRFACTEVIIEQEDGDTQGLLEPFLADASAENTRIRQAVIDAFFNRKWKVRDPSKFENGIVTDNIMINSKGYLQNL